MKHRGHHRRTCLVVVTACALVLGAEAWWLSAAMHEARTARAVVAMRANEIALLQALEPAPDSANEERLRARRMQLEAQLAESPNIRRRHAAPLADEGSQTLEPADVYFQLATCVDGLRRMAAGAGVGVAPDERFGFKEYANAGPPSASAAVVSDQSVALQFLVEKLIKARPHQILRVQRGRPPDDGNASALDGGPITARDSEDYFELVKRDSMRELPSSRELVFRIDFTGDASSLRTLLNDYAAPACGVIVRQVEVTRAERSQGYGLEGGGLAEQLVVDEPLCRFSIVAEVIGELNDLALGEVLPRLPGARWEEPVGQSGAEWTFEVFGPPRILRQDGGLAARPRSEEVTPIPAPDTSAPFGLSLVSLEAEQFRLQLVGFAGEEESPVGVFENVETREMLLASAGRRLPQLSLTVVSFKVELADFATPDGGSTKLRVGAAAVRDERSGELVHLNTVERRFSREPVARVVFDEANARTRSVRVGDVIEDANGRYHVDAIRASENGIVVTREVPGRERETRALTVSNRALAQTEAPAH